MTAPANRAGLPDRDDVANRRQTERVRIIGCGGSLRNDDQVGLRVAELLSDIQSEILEITTSQAPGVDLPLALDTIKLLIVIDAAHADNAGPGEWRRIAWRTNGARPTAPAEALVSETPILHASGHTLGVIDALRLAEALGTLPPDVWIYAIVAEKLAFGTELSATAALAADEVARAIPRDIATWRSGDV